MTSAFNDEFDEGHAVEEFQLKVWAKEEVRRPCVHAGADRPSHTIFAAAGVSRVSS